ncbi:putative chromatin remodeling & transcriptional activation HMG family [Helianthus annuus]|nr:putative chromatin remodeling & transcriptional activation HMG family [Helianthus annuus]KAJ0718342.1 putative chromatin remodeling & transcriptional activation HMG family [Helianthus annuus]
MLNLLGINFDLIRCFRFDFAGSNHERGQINRCYEKNRCQKIRAPKDPNKPKRPGSALFLFIMEFREKFKEENPDYKYVAASINMQPIFNCEFLIIPILRFASLIMYLLH